MGRADRATRILIECPEMIPSVRVGVMRILSHLVEHGKCELRYRSTRKIRREDIAWCDIVVCVRGCEKATVQFLHAAKQAGRFLLYFLDDDLLDIPTGGNESSDYFGDRRIRENLIEALSGCDLLWTVNPRIAEKYSRWCKRAVLSDVPAEVSRRPPELSEKIHVLYAGHMDHNGVVREKLSYAVPKILEDYPGMVDFTFIGADPGLADLPGVLQYPFLSYDEYRKVVREGDFAVGLAPLFHTSFSSCKYFNKYLEYAENGIAGIYENCEPYTFIVRDGENGFLCGETPEDWYQKLKELLSDREKISAVAHRSAKMLKEEFSPEQIGRKLSEAIPELTAFHGRELLEREVRMPSLRWSFYKERIGLAIRLHGLRSIVVIPVKACKLISGTIQKRLRRGG